MALTPEDQEREASFQDRPHDVTIDRATLEQMVVALNNAEDALNNSQALIAGRERFGFAKPCYAANEIALGFVSPAITAGRAALANESTKSAPKPGFHDCTFDAAPQAQQMEPTDDQLVKGVKAMRLFVTKNSVADFRLGYMAALAAAPAPQPAQPLLAHEVLKLNALWNKSSVKDSAIADQLAVCRALAESEDDMELTDAQILTLWEETYVQRGWTGIEFARAIERAHGIGVKQ